MREARAKCLPADQLIRDEARWYVVRSAVNQERLALASVRQLQLDAYLPQYLKANHKGELFARPFFPGHFFVRMGLATPRWQGLYSARGVQCVLGAAGRPSPLDDLVIETIREKEEGGYVKVGLDAAPDGQPQLAHGDAVRVKVPVGRRDHMLVEGLFIERVDKRRCTILLNLIGKRITTAAIKDVEPLPRTA